MNDAPARPRIAARLETWAALRRRLAGWLRQRPVDAQAVGEITQAGEVLRTLRSEQMDLGLYTLLYGASHDVTGYSAAHAMTCAVVGELAAVHLGVPEDELRSLCLAALTMNLSITPLQDALAQQAEPLSGEQREAIGDHAAASAALLREAGVTDALWLEIVRRHHSVPAGAVDVADHAALLAELLRRVDIYTAKLSRRATRAPTTPLRAAREACLDASGHPDAIGAAMLRVIGLYPPGTWVELASGELALVTRTGAKAHTPGVVSLRRLDGSLLPQPTPRDTAQRPFQVRASVDAREVRVRVDHERVLAAGGAPSGDAGRGPA